MRSPVTCLVVRVIRPERFGRAPASGADEVILDFEDAVAPARRAMQPATDELAWARKMPAAVDAGGDAIDVVQRARALLARVSE